MAYFKIVRKTLEINGSSRSTSIDLRAEVFSYDKNVSKFLFELTSKEAEIDLTGATVRVLLTYVGNDGKKGIIEDNGGVEAYTMNQIYYLLPEELRGYDGTVVMGLYVDLPSGEAIDIQNVQFRMFKSSIDDGAGVAGVVYFKSFEEWLFQVKEKALLEIQNIDDESERITEYADTKIKEYDDKFVQSNQKMSELQQSQIELSDQLNETNKKIDEADVYRKDEVFNKPESSANVIYQLVGKEKVRMTFTADFSNKESGSDDKNPHWASAVHGLNELPSPSDFKTELVQLRYDSLKILDGQKTTVNTVAGTANQYPCLEHKWDIVEIIKRELSEDFFVDRGAIDKASQATVAKKIIVSPLESSAWGFGTCPSGNSLKIANHINGVGWQTDQLPPNTTNLVKQITARNTATPSIDDEGFLRTIIYTEASSKTVQSQINVDYGNLVFSIEISMNEHIKSMMAANHVENLATQEEAELGEDNTKTMTPLRTDQYFKAHLATQEEAENGVSHLKTMTPKRTAEQTLARFGQSFTPSTKFIAHRGNNYFYPENSIAAFEKTSRHWGAETDIQLTTDGKWYCFHDRTLDRMTNGTGNFMDKTSSEIEALRLDTGNGINTLSDVEKKIPTFEQYLNACIKARIVPVIEITPLKTDFTDAQLDSIVTVIRRKGLLNKCVIICFTYEVLVKMRQRMPYTVMHWLISEYSEEMIQKCVINNFVPSFDYSKASVNQALIDKIHDAGLECGLWTVPYSDHQKYTDMGVDNITTDSASGNLRYFEPALRSGMTANKTDLTGPTYIEETSNGEIHIRVNVTDGQNDVGVYICALEKWAIPRHSLTLIGYVRSTKVTGFSFVPVAVGVGGYSAQDASTADPNIKFGYLCTGTNWEQRSSYAAFDLFYRI